MTADERLTALHKKMEALHRQRERRKTAALGSGCAGLFTVLAVLIFGGDPGRGGTAGLYSGATMLFEGAGAYVLVAVLAFTLGVMITVTLIRRKNRSNGESTKEEPRK